EHHEKETVEEYTEEELKLMQTQDMNYVNMRRAREAQKVEKLKSQMHLLDVEEKPKNTHTFFVDSNEEVRNFDLAKRLDTNLALLGRSYNRPRLSQLKQMSLAVSDVDHLERVMEARNKKYKELNQRVEREKKLDLITR
ncbi:UTP11L (predicted), partial [Pycnogonum litorale]